MVVQVAPLSSDGLKSLDHGSLMMIPRGGLRTTTLGINLPMSFSSKPPLELDTQFVEIRANANGMMRIQPMTTSKPFSVGSKTSSQSMPNMIFMYQESLMLVFMCLNFLGESINITRKHQRLSSDSTSKDG